MIETLGFLRWLALLPLALLGLVLAGGWLGHLSLERTVRRLAQTDCPNCGVAFGIPAVRAARTGWEQEFAQQCAENPGVRFRTLAHWPLRCSRCARVFHFRVSDEQLLVV